MAKRIKDEAKKIEELQKEINEIYTSVGCDKCKNGYNGRIIIATFASNIYRVKHIFETYNHSHI